jgi:hypothetical protein
MQTFQATHQTKTSYSVRQDSDDQTEKETHLAAAAAAWGLPAAAAQGAGVAAAGDLL